jgi:hypothetical protein
VASPPHPDGSSHPDSDPAERAALPQHVGAGLPALALPLPLAAEVRLPTAPGLRELGAILLAPVCPGRGWDDPESEAAVTSLLAAVRDGYAIDSRRIAVTGFGMGGRGVFYPAARHPELFTAADDEPERAARMPFYVVHSRADEVVAGRGFVHGAVGGDVVEAVVEELQRPPLGGPGLRQQPAPAVLLRAPLLHEKRPLRERGAPRDAGEQQRRDGDNEPPPARLAPPRDLRARREEREYPRADVQEVVLVPELFGAHLRRGRPQLSLLQRDAWGCSR